MTSSPLDATAAAEYFLAGARDAGMFHVCISPGSRSTPMAVAAERTSGLTTSIHLDERVGAFSALGRSVATGRPVGLICTSGTAAANYLPAVSEASMSHVPLLVMTADRPPEHQHWGVGQTFDQTGLFHRQVRAEFAMPVGGDGGPDFSHRAGWRAATTTVERSGPVHVNWPFRLPLEPTEGALEIEPTFEAASLPTSGALEPEVERLVSILSSAKRPIIIAGPQAMAAATPPDQWDSRAKQLNEAASVAGVPILADALSGLRGSAGDALIARPALTIEREAVEGLGVDAFIHIGQTPTAKSLRLWWESTPGTHVLIDPRQEWHDPSHLANARFTADPIELLSAALEQLSIDPDHLSGWVRAGANAEQICADVLASWPSSHEGVVAASLGELASPNDVIVASSSMPVRDIDTFAGVSSQARVHSNRGVNGIDGVVATAAGIAATLSNSRCYVLIGDVALLHDVGGVLDAARNGIPVTIITVNNDGGGIFSHLPARERLEDATFDRLFQTPHGASFEFLGGYPGVRYSGATDLSSGLAVMSEPGGSNTVDIIEIHTSAKSRPAEQRELIERLRS